MAVDLNKLIADAEKKQKEAEKRAATAKKQADAQKKDKEKEAVYKRLNDYISQLKKSKTPFEDIIKNYAARIARGDKLNVLEKKELDNAIKQYNGLDDTISNTQKDVYDLYVGKVQVSDIVSGRTAQQQEKPAATTTVTGAKTQELPMGAGAVTPAKVTTPAAKKTTTTAGAKVTPGKVATAATPTPFEQVGATPFTQPMTLAGAGIPGTTGTPLLTGDVFAQAQSLYGGIDEVFRTNDELKNLLTTAIAQKWTQNRFLNELENTKWFKTNAGPIRQRGFYKRQYDDLVNQLKTDDPNYQGKIDELNKTSEYGRGLQNAIETVTEEWTSQYGTPTGDDLTTIKAIATELYQYANEGDAVKIRNLVLAKPKRFSATSILGGAAGQNIAELKSVAAANGLDLNKDFGTSIQTWLDRIAKGESIETIKSIIRNTAKTTWNVNDRIAGLLDQGVDLDTIYSPYKTRMANILEISPGTISFADLASKGVIGGQQDKNLYDFEKELRKDPRWQYTNNAREDVSNVALKVLQDFGFMG